MTIQDVLKLVGVCVGVLCGGFVFLMFFPHFGNGDLSILMAMAAYVVIVMIVCTYLILHRLKKLSEMMNEKR